MRLEKAFLYYLRRSDSHARRALTPCGFLWNLLTPLTCGCCSVAASAGGFLLLPDPLPEPASPAEKGAFILLAQIMGRVIVVRVGLG